MSSRRDWRTWTPKERWVFTVFSEAKRRAKDNGLPFTIERHKIETPDVCEVLGAPLIYGQDVSERNRPSLDKIIPSLGYVPGNVRTISARANRLKNDANLDEMIKIAEYVVRNVK